MKYLASSPQKFEGHQKLGILEKLSKKEETKETQKLNVFSLTLLVIGSY